MSKTRKDQPVPIDIISDVVCPWCYIGKARLEAALQLLPPETRTQIVWHPYQLDPTIPPEGIDRRRYMTAKFGSQEKIREVHRRIGQAGLQHGIRFDFDAIEISPNTLDAHRLLHWAGEAGGTIQHHLAGLLFSAYFELGANLGDPIVLAATAREAGLDGEWVETQLQSDRSRAEVEQQIGQARRMGVTGVPCFIIGRKYAVVGAQEPERIAEVIQAVASGSA